MANAAARAAEIGVLQGVWTRFVDIWRSEFAARGRGIASLVIGLVLVLALASYHPSDPSLNAASADAPRNLLRGPGAALADAAMQSLGLAAWAAALVFIGAGAAKAFTRELEPVRGLYRLRTLTAFLGVWLLAASLSAPTPPSVWPLARGLGGFWGDALLQGVLGVLSAVHLPGARIIAAMLLMASALGVLLWSGGVGWRDLLDASRWLSLGGAAAAKGAWRLGLHAARRGARQAPEAEAVTPIRARAMRRPAAEANIDAEPETSAANEPPPFELAPDKPRTAPKVANLKSAKTSAREERESQGAFDFDASGFRLPELAMLAKPKPRLSSVDEAALRQNARMLESVLAEFGVRGVIDQIRPGPVVTLYELAPAPGVKHSRVVALADDIARSMSARACRVSVVQGRNAIGIELPNARRDTVYLRDLLASSDYEKASAAMPLALGETIGGEPYIADLARMPHLLIAGTTGSGKSVGVNAMILSILYRLPPDQCRFIMVDPKMLELSVYDGIPHLLAPVVTDPKKAIVALKWTVREMEDRYRRMSKIGVRNIGGYNQKALEALERGEHFERTVQTGFDDAGRPIYESETLRPEPMPYLVVVIDEVADLMMVAGKDIEAAVQRLAQMARAAGIHLIMATQRPSVDVITGTIKANFPTRISFQVTSKIDARTILGEQGAEQLLGQGDMLYMAGGGRVTRLHGPFVSDGEVEAVAGFLRQQGEPQYVDDVTAGGDEEEDSGEAGLGGSGDDLYDQAVAVVTRDRKASTSYIQRRLQIGYNRAASLIERMEKEGVVSPANHAGKRDILAGPPPVV